MKPGKITARFPKRAKTRRNPFIRRNSLPTSLRRLYIPRPYSHGSGPRVAGHGASGLSLVLRILAVCGDLCQRAGNPAHGTCSESARVARTPLLLANHDDRCRTEGVAHMQSGIHSQSTRSEPLTTSPNTLQLVTTAIHRGAGCPATGYRHEISSVQRETAPKSQIGEISGLDAMESAQERRAVLSVHFELSREKTK